MNLTTYATSKGFTPKQLKKFGLKDNENELLVPYKNADGTDAARSRIIRDPIEKNPKGLWFSKGSGDILPYGLDRPVSYDNKFVFIVEGESDCWALWQANVPAIGLPGATNFRGLTLQHLKDVDTIAIIQEPDEAGKRFPTQVANHLYDQGFQGKIYALQLSEKDPRDLWLKYKDGFKERLLDEYQLSRSLIAPPSGHPVTSRSISMADVWEMPFDDVQWLLDGILPVGGVGLLASRPKVGKSCLARCIALAVARGSSFLDRHCEPGLVLWLALEERKEFCINSFKALGAKRDENIRFYFGSAPQDAMKWLANECKEHKPALIIIDTWHKLTLVENVNDYGSVNRANEPLVKLSRDGGITQLWLHHNTKSTTGDGNAVLGSSALFAAVDVLLTMSQDNDGTRALRTIQRVGEDLENTILIMDPITGNIICGDTRYHKNLEIAKLKILSTMHDDELTKIEIADSVRIDRNTAFAATNELIREGILVQVDGSNRYKSIRGNHRSLENEDIYNTSNTKNTKDTDNIKLPIDSSVDELFDYASKTIV